MILNANGKIDAKTIITDNGFEDTTPDTSLFTRKAFQKDGCIYRFVGWCEYKDRQYHAIELKPITD